MEEPNQKTRYSSTFSSPSVISGGYAGNLRKYLWDNNSIWFVEAPGNYTIWIKYDHNDNYETYYPCEWNRPWDIPSGKYGNEKFHTHMAVSDVYDWKTGAKSRDEIMQKHLSLGGTAAGSFLGALLGGVLLRLLVLSATSGVGILLTAVGALIGAIIGWFLQLLGVSEAQWIENVVAAEQGDGFYWTWGFHTKLIEFRTFEWHAPWLRSPKTEVLVYEAREFYRTWGKDRDGTPEKFTTEFWYFMYWNGSLMIR